MVRLLSLLLGTISIGIFFFSKTAACIIYAVPALYLVVNLWAMTRIQVKPIEGLSDDARALITRYPHWYTYPNVAKDNGAAARALIFFGFLLAVISYAYSHYWGMFIGVVGVITMLFVSRKVDPIRYLGNENQKKAHEEIVSYLLRR